MNESNLLESTKEFVKNRLEKDSSGHDWWHIYRVWRVATHLAQEEKADMLIVELAALLHDLGDYKINNGVELGSKPAKEWLESQEVEKEIIEKVCHTIDNMSFSKKEYAQELSHEGKIVQDADRLDAIGAIGVARAFAFSGKQGNIMHNPNSKPNPDKKSEEYKKADTTTVNHFHEKLLLLKEKMNTESAKKMAEARHAYMEQFLSEFHQEWEGRK